MSSVKSRQCCIGVNVLIRRKAAPAQQNLTLCWRHNIYKHYKYLFLKIASKPLVYIDPRIPLNHYTSIPGEQLKNKSSDICEVIIYFTLLRFSLSPFKYYHYLSVSPIIQQIRIFPFICWFLHRGKSSQERLPIGKLYLPKNNLFHTIFFWQGTDPQIGSITSACYSQSDCRKILEPPRSVLDNGPLLARNPWISH